MLRICIYQTPYAWLKLKAIIFSIYALKNSDLYEQAVLAMKTTKSDNKI